MFFFSKNCDIKFEPKSLEHAYLAILNEDLATAKLVFTENNSPRALWGQTLAGILSGYIDRYPTYFEIRNFLEIDLDFLLKNDKLNYVEFVLGALEILVGINQETYKYVARVMYENKLYKAAFEYLEKSKNIFYNDPELLFMFAKYYIKVREYATADYYLDECLNILPDYYPALQLQKEISRYLA